MFYLIKSLHAKFLFFFLYLSWFKPPLASTIVIPSFGEGLGGGGGRGEACPWIRFTKLPERKTC